MTVLTNKHYCKKLCRDHVVDNSPAGKKLYSLALQLAKNMMTANEYEVFCQELTLMQAYADKKPCKYTDPDYIAKQMGLIK